MNWRASRGKVGAQKREADDRPAASVESPYSTTKAGGLLPSGAPRALRSCALAPRHTPTRRQTGVRGWAGGGRGEGTLSVVLARSWFRPVGSGRLPEGGGGGAERLPEFPSPLFLRSANAQATVYAGRYHKPAHNAGRPDSARQGDARFGAHRLPRRCHPGTQPDDAPLPRAFPSLLRPGLSGPRSLRRCESSSWMTPPGPSCATSRARCARTTSWC
jgi:hypothetical protein